MLAQLLLINYVPDRITKGMWFKKTTRVDFGELESIYELDHDIRLDREEKWIENHGYPVKPILVTIPINPDEGGKQLADSDQIGWWDDGEKSDEYRDIEVKDVNLLLDVYEGIVNLEIDEEELKNDLLVPIIYHDKVIMSVPKLDVYNDDEEDDEFDF